LLGTALRYGLPLLALTAVTAGFLRAPRYRPLGRWTQRGLAVVAALPLLASGTVHLLRPAVMVPLLPPWVPGRTLLIMATALPELAGAVGLFLAKTRRPAAAWLAVFMIVIFPANVYVAGQTVNGLSMPGVPVRAAMQAVYILLLLIVGYGWPVYTVARPDRLEGG
jgi:uncharacterized membrane protein